MKWVFWVLLWSVSLFGAEVEKQADTSQVITYNPPRSNVDSRLEYNIALLRAILDASKDKYGSYRLVASEYPNQTRSLSIKLVKTGRMSLTWSAASKELEKELLPIRFPIFKGLLGYRIFLIQKKDQDKFSKIRSLNELKRLKMGTGLGWSVTKLYSEYGFNLLVHPDYEELFRFLSDGFYDYFSRGIQEVQQEYLERRKLYPNLKIESTLALYHPLPFYMYVGRSETGEKLADRLQYGISKIRQNGRFDQLFQSYFGDMVSDMKLSGRRLFTLENPDLSKETPLKDPTLWLELTKPAKLP